MFLGSDRTYLLMWLRNREGYAARLNQKTSFHGPVMTKEDRKILKEFTGRIHERLSDARVWASVSRANGETARVGIVESDAIRVGIVTFEYDIFFELRSQLNRI